MLLISRTAIELKSTVVRTEIITETNNVKFKKLENSDPR